MKVLYITHYIGNYGANKALLQLILDLKEKNVKPIVLIPFEGQFSSALSLYNIEYVVKNFHNWRFDINNDNLVLRYLKFVYYISNDFFNIVLFSWAIKKEQISLIHTNSSMIPAGGVIAKLLRIPHVWHLREFGEGIDYEARFYLGRKVSGLFIDFFSNRIIAISQAIKDYYSTIVKNDKFSIIYDGLPINKINLDIPIKKAIKDKLNICVIGRIGEGKNQMEILEALRYIEKNILDNVKLYIIGDGDHKYLSLLKNFVSNNKLKSYVDFLGYRDDIYQLLENMHIGIVPSKSEGYGLVTIEYMFHKVAVIAANSGANIELIKEGKNGLLYSLGDFKSLGKKIECLSDNSIFREELVEKAFLSAKERFQSRISSHKIFSIYHSILKG